MHANIVLRQKLHKRLLHNHPGDACLLISYHQAVTFPGVEKIELRKEWENIFVIAMIELIHLLRKLVLAGCVSSLARTKLRPHPRNVQECWTQA